jgi:ribose transport system ATP-binding protein
MININKDFSGVQVLYDVCFNLRKGEVHAIIGQNGAGKSVLMKILNGVYQKSSGKIMVEGNEVNFVNPHEAMRNGIGMIYQEFSLIPTMSVARNIFLNREPKRYRFVDDRKIIKESEEILKDLGISINVQSILGNLTVSHKQIVEIAKIVSQERKIIVMDEPTASLSRSEISILSSIIKRLKEKGIGIVYITHRLSEIFEICDRVSVIRDGRRILTEDVKNVTLGLIIESMLGKKIKSAAKYGTKYDIKRSGVPILEIRDMDLGGKEKISFKVWAGEVIGLIGLMGAGQDRIVKSIFGILPDIDKKLLVSGSTVFADTPEKSLKYGIAMVPEERQVQGLIIGQSIKANMLLSILDKLKKLIFIDDKKGNIVTKQLVEDLQIKTDDVNKKVKLLSGGNQQKVVMAKCLLIDPDIMLLNDPNFGVDIGSKQEILQLIRNFADRGKCAVFISSEFEEVSQICDRILVIKEGSIINEINRNDSMDISEASLLRCVLSQSDPESEVTDRIRE